MGRGLLMRFRIWDVGLRFDFPLRRVAASIMEAGAAGFPSGL